MDDKKPARVAGALCLAALFAMMLLIGLRILTREAGDETQGWDTLLTRIAWCGNDPTEAKSADSIDWEAQYSFQDEDGKPFAVIQDKAAAVKSLLEKYATSFLPGRSGLVLLTARYESIFLPGQASSAAPAAPEAATIAQAPAGAEPETAPEPTVAPEPIDDWPAVRPLPTALPQEDATNTFSPPVAVGNTGILRLYDGHLTTVLTFSKQQVREAASAVSSLKAFCDGFDIPFFYVQIPYKICPIEDPGIERNGDTSNQNIDQMISALDKAGVSAYDIRPDIHADGLLHHGLFYLTDHHWTPEAGLWAARHILTELSERFGFQIDPSVLDPDRFYSESFPGWHLGMYGKTVTLENADPEDMNLLHPRYPTQMHYVLPSRGKDLTGDFSVLYSYKVLEDVDYYNACAYCAYLHGNKPFESITNELADNDLHILILRDSFGAVVVPFLALGAQRVDTLDLRTFTGSVRAYIEQEQPDLVMVMYSPVFFGDTNTSTHTAMFDFQ
ncbi:MAG: hypothetical protein IJ594_03905 [Oscillospiraceae bacterium]|nr:hypothetical protein [Oscillospiraceae bacterium]